ncbi:MAG: PEGA domain-containing protein [Myxococcota bacterium]
MKTPTLRIAPVVAATMLLAAPAAADAPADDPSDPTPSSSDDPSARKREALQVFEQGAAAYRQRRYFEAIRLFLRADELASNPAFAFNIALAYEQVGDASRALRWSRQFLREANDAPSAERDQIEELSRRLQLELAEAGLQQLTIRSSPSGATLFVDGEARGVTPWTGDLVPGRHELSLRRDGFRRHDEVIELAKLEARDVAIALAPEPTVSSALPAAPDEASDDDSEAVFISSITLLAAGAAGIGTGIALEALAGQAEDDARAASIQVDVLDHVDEHDRLSLGSRIAFGVGGGLAAIGAVMLAFDLTSDDSSPDDAARLGGACDFTGCRAMMRVPF